MLSAPGARVMLIQDRLIQTILLQTTEAMYIVDEEKYCLQIKLSKFLMGLREDDDPSIFMI